MRDQLDPIEFEDMKAYEANGATGGDHSGADGNVSEGSLFRARFERYPWYGDLDLFASAAAEFQGAGKKQTPSDPVAGLLVRILRFWDDAPEAIQPTCGRTNPVGA